MMQILVYYETYVLWYEFRFGSVDYTYIIIIHVMYQYHT